MRFLLTILLSFLIPYISIAQCSDGRYTTSLFSVEVELDVQYGAAPRWNFPYNDEDLLMDIYRPFADEVSYRPCIIWAHPGGFLLGDKQADDMITLCDSLAQRGYVTATIGYRKGFNPLDANSSERAVYRGFQDGRAAYRFLVENYEEYGIDTTRIFMGGSSAGALIALHVGSMEDEERPDSSYELALAPDLECIDCSGNDFNHEVNPLGIIGLWGAIGDTTWVNIDVNTLMIHGTEDAIVPYETGPPFELFTLPDVFGSAAIHEHMQNQGFNSTLISVEGEGHEPHGTTNGYWIEEPTPFWDEMFHSIEEWCHELIRPEAPVITGAELVCEGEYEIYSVQLGENETVCWQVEGGDFQEVSEGEIAISPLDEEATLTAVIINEINASSQETSFTITQAPTAEAAWNIELQDNFIDYSALTLNQVEWFIDGELFSNEAVGFYELPEGGTYTVSVIISTENGCSYAGSEEITLTFNSVSAFQSVDPTLFSRDGSLHISSGANSDLTIYDLSGRTVSSSQGVSHEVLLNSGVYIIRLMGDNLDYRRKIFMP